MSAHPLDTYTHRVCVSLCKCVLQIHYDCKVSLQLEKESVAKVQTHSKKQKIKQKIFIQIFRKKFPTGETCTECVSLCVFGVCDVRRRSQVSVMCDDHYCHTPAPLPQLTLPMQMSLIA